MKSGVCSRSSCSLAIPVYSSTMNKTPFTHNATSFKISKFYSFDWVIYNKNVRGFLWLPLPCCWSVKFLITNISQGSEATCFTYGGIFNSYFIANLLPNVSVEKNLKYMDKKSASVFFLTRTWQDRRRAWRPWPEDNNHVNTCARVRVDYVSVTSTLYSDMTLDVDQEAFRTPPDCQQLTGFDFSLHEMTPVPQLHLRQKQRRTSAKSLSTFCFLAVRTSARSMISQGSTVTQTVLGGLTIYPPIATGLYIVYMCQKLWKLADSRQRCCKNKQACFFGPPCTCTVSLHFVVNTVIKQPLTVNCKDSVGDFFQRTNFYSV